MTEATEVQEQSPAAKAMKSEADQKTTTTAKASDLKKAVKVLTGSVVVEDLIQETAASVEIIDAASALNLIPELLNNIELSFFKVGGLLCRVKECGWWQESGHETFAKYLEAVHGLGYRKAMYLIDIYENLVNSGVQWEQVKDVGWTKLRLIAPLLNQDNVASWVDRAMSMTTIQLEEYIKAVKAGESSDSDSPAPTTSDVSSKVFKLHSDQREIVEAALDKCKHDSNTEHDNVALQYICEMYLNEASGKKKPAKAAPTDPVQYMKDMGIEKVLEALGTAFPEADFEVTM
jgi:hypothetical protein